MNVSLSSFESLGQHVYPVGKREQSLWIAGSGESWKLHSLL